MSCQTMLRWHKDYFEMKVIEKKQVQKGLSTLSSLPSSRAYTYDSVSELPYREEENSLSLESKMALISACINRAYGMIHINHELPPVYRSPNPLSFVQLHTTICSPLLK